MFFKDEMKNKEENKINIYLKGKFGKSVWREIQESPSHNKTILRRH
jgi:hypothetical protein